ncbi:hypothetical protein [Streptomyces violascens]|uniref:hypothetical protein n=1 Tax=Streptomyces violascens TaxID=67381 RepID=UPI0036971387
MKRIARALAIAGLSAAVIVPVAGTASAAPQSDPVPTPVTNWDDDCWQDYTLYHHGWGDGSWHGNYGDIGLGMGLGVRV